MRRKLPNFFSYTAFVHLLELQEILQSLKSGNINTIEAEKLLSIYAIEKVEDYAMIDVNRNMRRGIPEIVFAETKKRDEIKEIIKRILQKNELVVVSRIKESDYKEILSYATKNLNATAATGRNSTTVLLHTSPIKSKNGSIGILAAGTSDIGVAEEARLVCESMGCKCITGYDVGVAGLQRVFPILKEMIKSDVSCIIIAAGMEGALATLVSSLVRIPVIGVPTSVGYGYGQKGIAALASMLQSCSLGMAVVNIDNGIAAGGMAANIANRRNANAATQDKDMIDLEAQCNNSITYKNN